MKKLILALFLLPVLCFAQPYKLGDYVEVDGIPAVVIKVNNDGTHGVMMSAPIAYEKEKQVNKALKNKEIPQCLANKFLEGTLPYWGKPGKLKKAVAKEKINDFYASLTLDGEKNAELYRKFCEENNLDMGIYFPAQNIANKMGNGWFIPGAADVPDFVGFLMKDMKIDELSEDDIIALEKGRFDYKYQSDYREYIKDFLKNYNFVIPLKMHTSSVREIKNYCSCNLDYGTKGTKWWYRVIPADGGKYQNSSWPINGLMVSGAGWTLGEYEKFKIGGMGGGAVFNGFYSGKLEWVAFRKF